MMIDCDYQVWSEDEFNLPASLPESDKWEQCGNKWKYEFNLPASLPESDKREQCGNELKYVGEDWHVLVMVNEAEDVPEPVQQILPRARHVAFVTVDPFEFHRASYWFVERVVRGLAEKSRGVWCDAEGTMAFFPNQVCFL